MEEEAFECSVCAGSAPPLYRPCACNHLVHAECFQRMVSTVPAHHTHCPACKMPNPGTKVCTVRYVFVIQEPMLVAIDVNFCIVTLFTLWVVSVPGGSNQIVVAVKMFFSILWLVISFSMVYMHLAACVRSQVCVGISI